MLTWKAKLIAVALVLITIGGLWIALKIALLAKHNMELRLETAEHNLVLQKDITNAFETQLQTEIKKIGEIQTTVDNLSAEYSEHQTEISTLQQKFSKHNLKKLSEDKPTLIQNILNRATNQSIKEMNSIGVVE